MNDLLLNEEFSSWENISFEGDGKWSKNGWRYVSRNNDGATLKTKSNSQDVYLEISRDNSIGDVFLDMGREDDRIQVQPDSQVFFRVWAKIISGIPEFDCCLEEFGSSRTQGKTHDQHFPISDEFKPYSFQVKISPETREINPVLKISGTGSLGISRVELVKISSSETKIPKILLPQGRTPNSCPTLWWDGSGSPAHQVQLGEDISFQKIIWDSGTVIKATDHIILPKFVPEQVSFARVRVKGWEGTWGEWSEQTLITYTPMPQLPEKPLVIFDLNYTRELPPQEAFEHAHLVAALQGIVNRDKPNLFIKWLEADDFWLNKLREKDRWLEKVILEPIDTLEGLVHKFADQINGVVLWDPKVNATSNVASTISGIENLLPIPKREDKNSLYQKLILEGPQLSVPESLVDKFIGVGNIPDINEPSSGSTKNDAYRWAIKKYLETGKCNPTRLGYYIDAYWIKKPELGEDFSNHTLTNQDFFIQQKGFLWDLNVWPDETPVDDPDQPMGSDYNTLLTLLHSAHKNLKENEVIHCGGFTPWAIKYTDCPEAGGKNGGVQTEWETVRILSAFDAVLDADALHFSGLANASIYSHMSKPVKFNQPPAPLKEECIDKGWLKEDGKATNRTFLIHYVGDYDAASWLTTLASKFWQDFRRGEVVLPWAWNPNLMERGGAMFDEFNRTRTPKDFLWAGDNGAGYLNPTQLFSPRDPSGLPEETQRWEAYCKKWLRLLDIRTIGFIINGRAGDLSDQARDFFLPFASDGIIEYDPSRKTDRLYKNMPVLPNKHNGFGPDPQVAADEVRELVEPGKPNFMPARSVLFTPSYYRKINRAIRNSYPELNLAEMNPAEFFYVLRSHLGGKNEKRATFIFDTLPEKNQTNSNLKGKLWIRNIGWDTWENEGNNKTQIGIEFVTKDSFQNPLILCLPETVLSGEMVEIPFKIQTPGEKGPSFWRVDLMDGTGNWFELAGNLPDFRQVLIQ